MNRLKNESSPYLRQHAENPVDWYPWGPEALEKARVENKVILVSIGYSACHWCHVMAHECFENKHLAAIMNAHFVNIKLDREERPDIDTVYMDALHSMGLRGGWPLNVFLMPDTKPFYGGTYFPPKHWEQILTGIQQAFETEREKLQASADSFATSLNVKDSEKISLFELQAEKSETWTAEELEFLNDRLKESFDIENGGFGGAPKFPMPCIWRFLFDSARKYEDPALENHLKFTLDRIALGGIFDHLAGGWARYSTDAKWKVPHFEKMLYDNAQLISLYSEAYHFFKQTDLFQDSQQLYAWAVEKTIDWLQHELKSANGLYFAALDADSEGVEGKYYIWEEPELQQLLANDYARFAALYEIGPEGNWENGYNVLHLEKVESADWQFLNNNWLKLKPYRNRRVAPGLDDKHICSWNALLLSALVSAATVFRNDSYYELAAKLAETIDTYFLSDFEHSQTISHLSAGKTTGFLDDYATVIQSFISFYQLSFDEKFLIKAKALTDAVLIHFYDEQEGLFFYTDERAEQLIARKKEIYDNVIPASNSMLAEAMYTLGKLLADRVYTDRAEAMFAKVKKMILAEPGYMGNWARLGLWLDENVVEVTLSGPQAHEFRQSIFEASHIPIYFLNASSSSNLPLLQDRFNLGDETCIYVCRRGSCHLPVNTPEEALALIHDI